MRRFPLFVLAVFVVFAASALADSVPDPQMILDPAGASSAFCADPYESGHPVSPHGVTVPFTFSNTSSFAYDGGKFFCFQNDDPFRWASLDINVTGFTFQFLPSEINCQTDGVYFATCNKLVNGSGYVTDLLFSGGPGIYSADVFSIDIGPPPSCTSNPNQPTCGDWGPGTFGATAPEPGAIFLLASGALALLGRRRRWS